VNINLTVAKQNISMQAVGIGDCLVHCVDTMGRPCKLEIKDVLNVPTASRNILSSSPLAAQIYQTKCAAGVSSGIVFSPSRSESSQGGFQSATAILSV
jgi:hypothetical protein